MTNDYKSPLKEALCQFKEKKIKIFKESDNPFFKSKYADLAVILDAVEAEAAKCGLVVFSRVKVDNGERLLETIVSHKGSAEELMSVFPIFGAKPQEIGSSVTYARRYNIQSLLNLAAEDDDGNAANDGAQVTYKTAKERTKAHNEIMDGLNKTADLDDLQSYWVSQTDNLNRLRVSEPQIFVNLENRKNELKKSFQQIEGD